MTLLHRRSARRPPTVRCALRGATSLVALGALLGGAARAQSVWNGATGDYNADANWSNQTAPIMAGQAAVFSSTGTATINVGTPVAPDGWTFDVNAQAYALTGAGVNFGGSGIANNSGAGQSIGNDVGGAGGLSQTGAGSLTLAGANSYTGATLVTAGTLIAGSDGAFSAASAYTVNGGTLQVNGVYTTVGSLTGTGGAVLINQGNLSVGSDNTSTTFAGTINGVNNAGASGLTKVGTGTLTLTGGNASGDAPFLTDVQAGTLVLSNGYLTAALTVAGGATLRVGADGGVNANNVTLYDNGVFDLSGFNVTVGSLASLATAGSTPTSSPPSTAANIVLGAGNLTILGNKGPNIGGVNENDFAGVVSGSGGVILTGGSAGLSGANTFTGGTTLSGGTLTVGSTAPAPTGSTITPLGAGVLTLDGGTLRAGGTYTLANGVAVNAAGGAIDVNGANLLSLSGVIADGSAATGKLSILDFTGSGQGGVQLTAANTFSGGVTVNGATVFADASLTQGAAGSVISSSLGTGAVFLENGRLSTVSSGTIANAIVLGPSAPGILDSNGFNLQVTGTIGDAPGGVGVLFIDGVNGGTTVLSGANTYTGGTVLQAGVLQLGADSVIANGAITSSPVGTGAVELAGGTLQSGGTRTLYNAIAIDSSGGTIDANGATLTLNGSVADGSGAGGVLTVTSGAGVPGTVILSGASSYTGATSISAPARLQAGTTNALSGASDFTVAGTLDLAGFSNTIGSLAGAGSVTLGSGTLTVGDGVNTTFSGSITGTGGLTKQGMDTLTLQGTNTYTGSTTIASGVLLAGATNAYSATSATSVAMGGTLDLGGFAQTIDAVALNGGTLQNGALTGAVTSTGGAIAGLSGSAGVTTTSGTTVLAGTNSYTEATTITGGATTANNADAYSATSATSVATGGVLDLGGFAQTIDAVALNGGTLQNGALTGSVTSTGGAIAGLSGSAGVTTTSGTTVLAGTNSYTGATAITGGATTANNADAYSATSATSVATGGVLDLGGFAQTIDAVALNGGTLQNGALTGAVTSTGGVISDLSGSTGVTTTSGTTVLAGTNSYTGATTITGGATTANNADAYSATSATSVATGGTLDLGGFAQTIDAVALNGGTLQNGALTGAVTSTGGAIAGLSGSAGVTTTSGTTVLAGTNSYTGATAITGGATTANNADAYSATSATSVAMGGTLDLGGFAQTIDAVALNGGTLQNGALTGSVTSTGGAIAGLSGSAGVTTTSGTTVLAGTNSYTEATTITGGATTANNADAYSATSATSVATGGVLDLGGFAQTIDAVALNGGTLQNGALTGSVTSTGGAIAGLSGSAGVTTTSGTTVLAGTNSYTGATAITGGATTANNADAYSATSATSVATGGVLDLGGFAQTIDAVALNGGTLQNGALTGAVTSTGGVISDLSGSTGVTTTSGTTVLAGTNSYTGATTITGGATTANNADAYSATSATSVATGGVLDLGGYAQTLLSLSGAGRVTNSGPLDALLTIDDMTGGAALFSGTITDGAKGRTALDIAEGTQYLAGINTYTGGTMIAAQGALVVGNGGSTGSVVGDIADSGVLAFNRSDVASYTGTISGSGSVYQIGSGTTILTADNTYTGGTNILAGTLQLGNGGTSGSVVGDIANGGTLTFDRSDTMTFANVISGSGTVVQNGSGTTVLSGANVYTGDTLVANGTLTVDGSIRSATTVASGATLDGNGSVGDVTVGAGGTLGAGSGKSIGLLSINGNVVFQQGSAYSVKILPSNQNDILLVSGQANLAGGTVRVLAGGTGYAPATRYLILNAQNGIESAFAGVTTNLAFLKPTLLYDANNVFLDVGNPLFTGLTGTTPTEAAVAQALQSGYATIGGNSNGLLDAVAGLSAEQAPAALAQLSGQATTATQVVSFEAGKQFMAAINDQSQSWLRGDRSRSNANEIVLEAKPMAYAPSISTQAANAFVAIDAKEVVPPTRTWRAWGTGYTNAQTLKGLDDGGLLDLNQRTSGGGFGADYQANPQLLVGFGVGGSTSTFSVPNSLTSGRLEGAHAGLYAAGRFADFYTTSALTYAHFDNTTNRLITDVGPRTTEHGHFGSDQIGGSFEAGYRKSMGGFTVSPFASVAFYDTFQSGYSETGVNNMAGLTFGARDASSVPLIVGAQIDGRIALGHGIVFEPYLRASYTHETIRHRYVDAFFTSVPLSFFTANGIVSDEDTADVKLGGRLFITPTTSLYASFDGVASSRSRGYSAMGGINFVSDARATVASGSINSVPSTPFTSSVTPDIRIDSFRSSRGYPAVSGPYGGRGSQVYASSVLQTSGTILPDTRLDLLAKPGVVYGRQGSAGLAGSVATPADTTASATFTYLAINGVQPFLSMNFNLPSGRTVLKGSAANARLDPDFVSVGTYGEGFNIGPTLGVNLPFSETLTASLSVGYTHHGAYDKEGPIDPVTFAQGTQLFAPGQDITFSANIGYVAAPFSTQASFSFAKQGITSTDGSPTFQAGDRFIGSLTEAYSWSPTSITNFTGTLVYSERNNILDTSLPAFIAEAFDSNNLVARLRLEHSFVTGKWTYGPVAGFVYRDRNGYDSFTAQFVPAKDIYLGGMSAAYAISEKASAKASIEYFHAIEANNPAANVGTVHTDGFHFGLVGSYVF